MQLSFIILLFLVPSVLAFGAGNIPSFAYLEGKAFRHGDIEDTLADLIKHSASGLALFSKGTKFGPLDVKRVYFGNWLRDFSQAVDVAGLKRLQLQSILTLCMILGFLAHGYATNEFEVTAERLGAYLPVEHIDNPKGYAEGEDARKYNPKLRGPVDPMELQIDPQTGMKNYIANERGSWDTSKAHVRRILQQCIHYGRLYRSSNRKEDEYEALRLLGTALHTLEDFSAHSNFCELALVFMGYRDVFTHVGDNARIQAPNGRWVAPIVTGTFGSNDFTFSLLGEASDHLSEASVTDLNKELDKVRARSQGTKGESGFGTAGALRQLFSALPGGMGNTMSRDMENVERLRAGPGQGGKRPEDMSPQELHSVLWQVLVFRDSVMKGIAQTISKIPGLGPLIEKITDSISVFVLSALEPFLGPLLRKVTEGLTVASGEVINKSDQYEVFNDPRASDPTHSFLSKDHFNIILNEPAGQVAKTVVVHAVNLVTKAWDDTSLSVQTITEDILSCLFHPDFHNPNSKIQHDMLECMRLWVDGLGSSQQSTLRRLSKEAVRNHQNVRDAGQDGPAPSGGSFATTEAHSVTQQFFSPGQNTPGMSLKSSQYDTTANSAPTSNYFATTEAHGVTQQFFSPGQNTPGMSLKSSQYVTTANTGAPTSNYASTTAEAKYTPGYQDYAAESSSSYTSTYRPPNPYQPYGTSNETSGCAPSYTPSYSPLPGPPPGPPALPAYSGYSGAEPAQFGRHHYGHEAGQESWQNDQPGGHRERREDLQDHSYHHHHHHESGGYIPGGFSEPVQGEPFQAQETPSNYPDTQPYPTGSRLAKPSQSNDSNQYGWRY